MPFRKRVLERRFHNAFKMFWASCPQAQEHYRDVMINLAINEKQIDTAFKNSDS